MTESATGVSVSTQLIVVNPRVITSSATGVAITPKLIEIQPTLIKVKPVGVNVAPTGKSSAPPTLGQLRCVTDVTINAPSSWDWHNNRCSWKESVQTWSECHSLYMPHEQR